MFGGIVVAAGLIVKEQEAVASEITVMKEG
jgi:hypothetical protein